MNKYILRVRAFNLIELMIVVAIVAILSIIAVPLYSSQMRESNRSDAVVSLIKLQLKLEQYYADNNNVYPASLSDSQLGITGGTLTSESGYYNLTYTPSSDLTGYTIYAQPTAASGQNNDTDCLYLWLTNTGQKGGGTTNTSTGTTCWK